MLVRSLTSLLVLAAALALATPRALYAHTYIKIGSIGGDSHTAEGRARLLEAAVAGHDGWIALESISFGGRSSPYAGARRMTAVRRADASSAMLARAARGRQRFARGLLIVTRPDGGHEFYQFEGIYITTHTTHGTEPPSEPPTEEVSFTFSRIQRLDG